MRTGHLRVGIIGCGAVAEQGHLPAFAGFPNATVSVLVDRNLRRAGQLAAKFRVPVVCDDYTDALADMDAAIVALPHFLHAPVSIDLLKRGIHVLVEKPMALTAAECEAMNAAAEESGAVLAAGLMRRYIRLNRWVKDAIAAGRIGRVLSFDIREGFVYNWPVASDFFFRKEAAGGGVLMDTGAHTLDSLIWWLGDVDSVRYFDDSYGGVEADCEAHITMQSGATGIVELSRTRELRNTAIIRGEKGTLEVPFYHNLLTA
ncbi:MAG: Gfo/Idh/MocA family oxidoreductase, partial [Chloroflexi bacterium]|nr:Gfo/Idh/MocA family oxidoreductase [Chloroflexota bacterium]